MTKWDVLSFLEPMAETEPGYTKHNAMKNQTLGNVTLSCGCLIPPLGFMHKTTDCWGALPDDDLSDFDWAASGFDQSEASTVQGDNGAARVRQPITTPSTPATLTVQDMMNMTPESNSALETDAETWGSTNAWKKAAFAARPQPKACTVTHQLFWDRPKQAADFSKTSWGGELPKQARATKKNHPGKLPGFADLMAQSSTNAVATQTVTSNAYVNNAWANTNAYAKNNGPARVKRENDGWAATSLAQYTESEAEDEAEPEPVAKVEDWGQCSCGDGLDWSQMFQGRPCKLHGRF